MTTYGMYLVRGVTGQHPYRNPFPGGADAYCGTSHAEPFLEQVLTARPRKRNDAWVCTQTRTTRFAVPVRALVLMR